MKWRSGQTAGKKGKHRGDVSTKTAGITITTEMKKKAAEG
jgi:hypothetical protein